MLAQIVGLLTCGDGMSPTMCGGGGRVGAVDGGWGNPTHGVPDLLCPGECSFSGAPTARAVALRLTTRVTFHQRVPEGGRRRWRDVCPHPPNVYRVIFHDIACCVSQEST